MLRERRIAFLARDLVWGDESDGSLPFSYAARKLEASVLSAEDLGDVATTMLDLRGTDPDVFVDAIMAFRPTLVAASTYIWSVDLFLDVAERVHRWDPSIRFVMGGPAARASVLRLAPYADRAPYVHAIVKGEGEEIIRRLARDHIDDDWLRLVPGMLARHALGYRYTGELERPALDVYASPYQLGAVPNAEHGYLETFRGCPISCAFCQWGEERSDRIYSAEYLAAHLRGFVGAGVRTVHVLDAALNLNSRAFRNLVEAEEQAKVLAERKLIGHVYPSYLKDYHFDFFSSLGQVELDVGVQSFDRDVLKNLGRPFDLDRFERLLHELAGQFPIDIEIILGLPGDDPVSFRRTFERTLEITANVRVFKCLALPDALLDRAEEFDIELDPVTFEVRRCRGWSTEELEAEWAHVNAVADAMYDSKAGRNWVSFRTSSQAELHRAGAVRVLPVASASRERLESAVERAAMGYRLRDVVRGPGGVILHLESAPGEVQLQASVARPGERCLIEVDGIAYSYRGDLARSELPRLRALIERVRDDVGPVARNIAGDAG